MQHIPEHLLDAPRVAVYFDRGRRRRGDQLHLLGIRGRFEALDGCVKGAGDIHRRHLELQIAGSQAVHVEQIVNQLRLQSRIPLEYPESRLQVANLLAARQNLEPAEDDVHRRAQLVAEGRQEFVLQPALPFGLVARVPLALEQALPLHRRLSFRGDVPADPDDTLALGIRKQLAAFGDPDDAAVGPDRAILDLVDARLQRRGRGIFDAATIVAVHGANDPKFGTERTLGKTEQDLGVRGPAHLAGSEVPLPGANLRHVQRHPQALFVFPDTPVRASQRGGSFLYPLFKLLVGQLQRRLRGLALGDFAMQRVVEIGERPRLAERFNEHADLRPQDLAVDGFAEIVHPADAVPTQDVLFVHRVGGEKQNRDILRPPALLDQRRQLEAVHAGHLDVEDQRGEVVAHQTQQRFVCGGGTHERAVLSRRASARGCRDSSADRQRSAPWVCHPTAD